MLWIYGARLERLRVRTLLGTPIASPYRPLPPGSLLRRLKARLQDPHTLLDLLYLLLLLPVGLAEFAIAFIAVGCTGSLLLMPTYYQAAGGVDWYIARIDTLPKALAATLLGILLLFVVPYILVGLGRGHAWLANALLGVNREAELTARVGQLAESRSRAVDAAVSELQRIERDLHDGAQQRLVKLAMDLGMAREKMKIDPAAAEALIVESHEEAKRAMAEIRDLVRGIYPAVLTDRGLDAAISALAGRAPIPVSVEVNLNERFPLPIEAAAYFVVAEALTNIARHSQAGEAHIIVQRKGDLLHLDVVDNGVGGADVSARGGLSGLADRLAALDGTLTVSSPAGGPTRIHAELPCGS